MNTVIVGQGAVGLLWYRCLSLSSNNNVQLSCSKNIEVPPAYFTFTALDNTSEKVSLATASTTTVENAEVILVCVKSFHVVETIRQLSSFINQRAIIILCHNGMGVIEKLPENIKKDHTIISMLLTHGAKVTSPFNAIHTGSGKTDIGLVFGTLNDNTRQKLLTTLNNALPKVYWQSHIRQQQWEKLAINCVINPITALNNIKNGDVSNSQYDREKMQTLVELTAIAKVEGIQLNSELLFNMVNRVALLTAKNSSSMRSDILAKRPTEIDYINGYIHQLGVKHQIPTPQNSLFWRQIKSLEKRNK